MIKTIEVKLKHNPYHIHIGENALTALAPLIKGAKIGSDAVVITTKNIQKLHAKKIIKALDSACDSILTLTIPDTEKSKQASFALHLIEKITKFDRKKRLFLLAFGGGVVGDLTGFIAAIYKRGVPYIQIPTTLLAQIDSSIGGKTAVDTIFGKNLVGAFYQPRFIVSDVSVLKTLPENEILSGLSEAIKYALIKDAGLFSFLEKNYKKILRKDIKTLNHLIICCATIKARVVAQDELDKKGIRIILNFGHTIGHAIEAASDFRISHGKAVSIGMASASRLSFELGFLKKYEFFRIIGLIRRVGLPTGISGIKEKKILEAMSYDKKFAGKLNRFVLLDKIGQTKILENIPQNTIKKIIALTYQPKD